MEIFFLAGSSIIPAKLNQCSHANCPKFNGDLQVCHGSISLKLASLFPQLNHYCWTLSNVIILLTSLGHGSSVILLMLVYSAKSAFSLSKSIISGVVDESQTNLSWEKSRTPVMLVKQYFPSFFKGIKSLLSVEYLKAAW